MLVVCQAVRGLAPVDALSPVPPSQVTITVLDENDNSPQFDITSDSSVSVAEDSAVGRRVALVLARDPDAGRNGQVGRETFGQRSQARGVIPGVFLGRARSWTG